MVKWLAPVAKSFTPTSQYLFPKWEQYRNYKFELRPDKLNFNILTYVDWIWFDKSNEVNGSEDRSGGDSGQRAVFIYNIFSMVGPQEDESFICTRSNYILT